MAPRHGDQDGRGGGGLVASAARFWTRSYAPDYVGFVMLVVGYILIQLVVPFHRMFAITDLRISFPYAEVERVPLPLNIIYALVLPLAIMVLVLFLRRAPPHAHHVAYLGLVIALVLTSFITDLVKNAVGRPRPDLLDRCRPAPGTPGDVLVDITVCTGTGNAHVLQDGWRSFPSGHSSFSFAGLGYVSLFLAGQLRLFVPRGGWTGAESSSAAEESGNGGRRTGPVEVAARGDLVRALVCLAPLLGAAMIAISRCQDYRHDVWDVCAGALLGSVVSLWSYRRYWPRLTNPRCDDPHLVPPREAGGRYGRLGDEEEGVGLNVGYELSDVR